MSDVRPLPKNHSRGRTPKGTAVAEVGLAVNRTWTDDEQRKREEVTFIDVILWNRQAEVAAQYLRRGSPVVVEGRLQLDSWEDKQTSQKRSRLRVVGENLQLLGSRPAAAAESSAPRETQSFGRRPSPPEPAT